MEIWGAEPGKRTLLRTVPMEVVDWKAMQADRELAHWLMELLDRTDGAVVFYNQALSRLDEIVEMIDKEIGPSDNTVNFESER